MECITVAWFINIQRVKEFPVRSNFLTTVNFTVLAYESLRRVVWLTGTDITKKVKAVPM